jgi:hypothetical protein
MTTYIEASITTDITGCVGASIFSNTGYRDAYIPATNTGYSDASVLSYSCGYVYTYFTDFTACNRGVDMPPSLSVLLTV